MSTKEIEIPEEDFIKRGRMKKSPFKMTEEEIKIWENQVAIGIRDHLAEIGQPLVFGRPVKSNN